MNMKLVIAIFGLLGTLSAQVICRPAEAKSSVYPSLFDAKKIASIANDSPLKTYLFTEYPSRPVRCFEHMGGTLALSNGKIVHDFWVEVTPFDRWISVASCSTSVSKEALFTFTKGIFEWPGPKTETKPISTPAEFCRATVPWPPATDN
jgi:hypothetical protein